MLKIKFNINEFTIIFLRRFEGKNERKRISFSLYQLQRPPLVFQCLLCFNPPFCFSASFLFSLFLFSASFFFCFCSAPLSFCFYSAPALFSPALTFSFLQTCCPFFSPKHFSAQDTFSAQNVFGSMPPSFLPFQRLFSFF